MFPNELINLLILQLIFQIFAIVTLAVFNHDKIIKGIPSLDCSYSYDYDCARVRVPEELAFTSNIILLIMAILAGESFLSPYFGIPHRKLVSLVRK